MPDEIESGSTVATVVETAAPAAAEVEVSFDMEKGQDELSKQLFGDNSKAGEVEVKEAAPKEAAAPEAAKQEEKPAETAAPAGAPKTWTKAAGETWATLPEAAKAEILRREEDMFKGIEGYKAKAAFGDSIDSILTPYKQILAANNMEPVATIQNLLKAHHSLATGTQESRQAIFKQLATSYGVSLADQPAAGSEAAFVDPQVRVLQDRIAQLESGQAQTEQARMNQHRQESERAVNAFASDPANLYFEECATEIAALIRNGNATDLADAYQKAIWLNPVTRAKELARIDSEKQAKAGEDAAKKIAETKAALAANVRSKPKAGTAAKPLGSMDDTMAATLADIKTRSN